MSSPSLSDLPPPADGQTGWPWTTTRSSETPTSAGRRNHPSPNNDPESWPTISIVTPSYNQARFVEETIRSVLLQDYPNLEYVVMDGGSTDGTVEILEKYDPWLDCWVSGPDDGQTDALNRGFQRTKGDILGWLNSDDLYYPDALTTVASTFCDDRRTHWLCGACISTGEQRNNARFFDRDPIPSAQHWVRRLLRGSTYALPQQSTFWDRETWRRCGPLNDALNFSFDHEFFLRVFAKHGAPRYIKQPLAEFRHHGDSKTVASRAHFKRENVHAGLKNRDLLPPSEQLVAPLVGARTRSRLTLYEAIDAAEAGNLKACWKRLSAAFRLFPLIVLEHSFLGFARRYLQGYYS